MRCSIVGTILGAQGSVNEKTRHRLGLPDAVPRGVPNSNHPMNWDDSNAYERSANSRREYTLYISGPLSSLGEQNN